VVGALLLALAPMVPARAAVQVRLSPEAVVTRDEVRLGDLGTIDGEPALAARLRAVSLGTAPAPGSSFRLDLDHIGVRLRQHRVDPAAVRLTGADRVMVSRAFQTLPGQALVDAGMQPALERIAALDPRNAPHTLVPLGRPPDLRLATGTVDLRARVQEPAPPYQFVVAHVAVRVDGRDAQAVPVSYRVARLVQVVVAAQQLEPRATLTLADFRLEARPSTEVPSGALEAIADPADLEPVRSIRAGEIVTARHFRPRMLVKRGETVTLVFEGRGFRITTVGQAVEDARRGDVVRVVNSTSRREVVGRVESSGRVRVSP
jgi:flagella basal body P-ring formation protein FlgA